MNANRLNTILISGNEYFWRDVSKIIDATEEHHYRVAESALADNYNSNDSFFNSDYDPPVYFVPLDILMENDATVVDWCERHGIYFD